ncbi:MAG: FtsW/RodA/SpoVE family cell cycle protein [Gammaproteobacteria bacterium]|nr:FtsW/RodA/SpoVE family cell cycle protein [Gammaproteobacteria bacterium]MCP5196460.1 FtsW/RodA/SpoVE family cell cycle protein [Gammaproteobacteria bacterium]
MRLSPFNDRRWLLLVWLLPVLGVGWTVARAPLWLEPHSLTVALEPDQTVVLGREALAARQADSAHVRIQRDAHGNWWLINLSASKQVLWQPAREWADRPVREWWLAAGATFTVGTHAFEVLEMRAGRLTLRDRDRRWEYDGLRLHLGGQSLPECYENWRNQLRNRLSDLPVLRNLFRRPLRLGGGVYCADRLGLPGVPVDTAMLTPVGSDFALRPGWAGRLDGTPVIVAAGTTEAESLWQRSIPLAVGDRLIIGRTQYQVARTTPMLELMVLARAWRSLTLPASLDIPSVVTIQWRSIAWWWPSNINHWRWPLGSSLTLLLLGLASLHSRPVKRQNRSTYWQVIGALTLAGACLGLHLSCLVTPILWPYLLAWPVLGLWLLKVRSPWSIQLLVALTLLLGIGLVTLLQLGIGAEESGWPRYGGSGAALAGTFGWLMWAGQAYGRWRPQPRWLRLNTQSTRWGRHFLSNGALMLLALQAMFGDEGGWAGFQPFELIKLALTVAIAYMLMPEAHPMQKNQHPSKQLSRWRALSSVVLLLAMSGFALAFLHDFSPIALLSIWALALIWAWAQIHSRPHWRQWGRLIVSFLALSMAGGLIWLHKHPESFPLDMQIDRIRVWATPDQYPHTGYQLRRAWEAIRAGDWRGTVWDDPVNGRVMSIPALGNDFTPAFFLHRYGGLAGLVLAAIQALFIGFLLVIARRAGRRTGSDDERATGRFIYFTLYGGAALLGAHFLVSWGTNLGFLPVMGQPMSLLSSAGSHLVLFVLPVVALAIVAEESDHGWFRTARSAEHSAFQCISLNPKQN